MNLARALDARWIVEHPRRTIPAKEAPKTEDNPPKTTGPSIPQPKHILEGVHLADEDSQIHRDRMPVFCFMQDFYAHIGLPVRYLTHQVDTWEVVQHFRFRYLGDPPAPLYRLYQYPGMIPRFNQDDLHNTTTITTNLYSLNPLLSSTRVPSRVQGRETNRDICPLSQPLCIMMI